jgi:hypothetical protein
MLQGVANRGESLFDANDAEDCFARLLAGAGRALR